MNSILNTTEIIGTVELPQGDFEVCASADASYDQKGNSLVVRLDANLRPCAKSDNAADGQAIWLPKKQFVTEHVAIDEAGEVARDIFKRWVRKIRESAPGLRSPTF
jgi:hypothetical protein